MENLKVSWILKEMSQLLELKGESFFKISAYQRGADIIEGLREPLPLIVAENRLRELPGIGEALARDIQEILKRGTCTLHEDLLKELPRGLVHLLHVPGVGPKKALLFYQELGISDISQLESAARRKRLRRLRGIGAKTEFQILSSIERLRTRMGKILLQQALTTGEILQKKLEKQPQIEEVSLVGGARRREEIMERVELLFSSNELERVLKDFKLLPEFREVKEREDGTIEILQNEGFSITIYGVTPKEYPLRLHELTGSKEHLTLLKDLGEKKKISIKREGLFKEEKLLPISSEEEIYSILQIPYIIPELRQGREEIERASLNTLPVPITYEDMKGDLHIHTSFSDGGHTLEEMVEGAIERGYSYLAICDHSPSLKVAGGLSLKRLLSQGAMIDDLQREYSPFTILKGVEVDILSDGTLDHPDDVLSSLDIVIASIHTGLRQDGEQITERILKAMENPYVHIIGHPTGRILGYRDPCEVDIDRILEGALKYNKILELNAAPDRLDLSDRYIKKARDLGVMIAINTDAHALQHLDYMEIGVAYGRRGYLEAQDVVNTYDLHRLRRLLS